MTSEADASGGASVVGEAPAIQPCGFLLELSPDWIVLRASENVHRFLGTYHVRMVGEPLASFTLAQPLHDLRNSLARLQSSAGIARAYRVRLVDSPRYFDISYQVVEGRILLEGLFSAEDGVGSALGSVSRLIHGLGGDRRALLDSAARRMRAMTGFDRVVLTLGDHRIESTRSVLPPVTLSSEPQRLPAIIADTRGTPVPIHPRSEHPGATARALLRAPSTLELQELESQGIRSMLNLPLHCPSGLTGCFSCDNRTPLQATFELHAAAELFAQVLTLQLDGAARRQGD